MEEVWTEITDDDAEKRDYLDEFIEAVRRARLAAARKGRQDAAVPYVAIEAKRRRHERDEAEQRIEDYIRRQGLAPQALPPQAAAKARTLWRSSMGPLGMGAAHGLTATAAENDKRNKFVAELVDVLIAIDSPAARAAADTGDLRGALSLAAGGRRANTLRTRLRAWRAFARWLKAAHDEAWISHWGRVIEYARMRAMEPCGRQTLLGIFWAITFINRAAGYAAIENSIYSASCEELLAGVSSRAGGAAARPAPTALAMHLACFEAMVVDEALPVWLRAYSAWKRSQCWGGHFCSTTTDECVQVVSSGSPAGCGSPCVGIRRRGKGSKWTPG